MQLRRRDAGSTGKQSRKNMKKVDQSDEDLDQNIDTPKLPKLAKSKRIKGNQEKIVRAIVKNATDYDKLRRMLKKKSVTEKLSSLEQHAHECSDPFERGNSWEPASPAFCDGIEILLGSLPRRLY